MKHLPATALRSNGADYLRTYHHLAVGLDVGLDDILRPGFWLHHSNTLRVHDLIDVVSDSMDVQLRVVEKGIGWVKMRPRYAWVAETIAAAGEKQADIPEVPEGYEVKRGPGGRFRVFQKDPLLEISTKTFVSEYDAVMAARVHFNAANAVAA